MARKLIWIRLICGLAIQIRRLYDECNLSIKCLILADPKLSGRGFFECKYSYMFFVKPRALLNKDLMFSRKKICRLWIQIHGTQLTTIHILHLLKDWLHLMNPTRKKIKETRPQCRRWKLISCFNLECCKYENESIAVVLLFLPYDSHPNPHSPTSVYWWFHAHGRIQFTCNHGEEWGKRHKKKSKIRN